MTDIKAMSTDCVLVCPHCDFKYVTMPSTLVCKWCRGTFKKPEFVLPPRKELK